MFNQLSNSVNISIKVSKMHPFILIQTLTASCLSYCHCFSSGSSNFSLPFLYILEHCVQFSFVIPESPVFIIMDQISHHGSLVYDKMVSFTSPNIYCFETKFSAVKFSHHLLQILPNILLPPPSHTNIPCSV